MDPEVLKRLDALGAKLEVTGRYLWEAAVRREVAEGISAVVAAVFAVITFALYARWLRKDKNRLDAFADGHIGYGFPIVFLAIGVVVAVVVAIAFIPNLVAPEGSALKTLIGGK